MDGRIRFVYAACGRRYFCIRIKKFADTKISGYVWTGPEFVHSKISQEKWVGKEAELDTFNLGLRSTCT